MRIELRMEECEGSHAQVRPTLTGVCPNNSLIPSPNKSLRCRAQLSGVVKFIVSTFSSCCFFQLSCRWWTCINYCKFMQKRPEKQNQTSEQGGVYLFIVVLLMNSVVIILI